ncbi:hypothetical protein CLOM_g16927 [Closterium sp. NIES-68]|nr:hypothetical protein CLOM_g16927 [Closterium sp. NIES-68]GJP65452.1 hypothetical protein CLOP_g22325 [Closterium sp. NIES-67]
MVMVSEDRCLPLQHLARAVACFSNLTRLHLSESRVETLNDVFLAHLAASCPKLKAVYVGRGITPRCKGSKDEHPVTEAGLDHFFRQCTQLEELSLFCLHEDFILPPSFFDLAHLHTLAVTHASVLDAPDLVKLSSLTSLYYVPAVITCERLSNLARVTSLTELSMHDDTRLDPEDEHTAALAMATIARLPRLNSFNFRLMFRSACTTLERLRVCESRTAQPDSLQLERLPIGIGDLLPSLRELAVLKCCSFSQLPEELTSLRRLEILKLVDCRVRSLPENFGSQPALKALVLSELLLAELPESFSQLTSLETLLLIHCPEVRQLPAGFWCLTALKTLCLKNLSNLTLLEGPGELVNLHTLNLDGNENMHAMHYLQELYICSCDNLANIPESLTLLTGLRILSVTRCRQLSSVPRRMDNLTQLSELDLTLCHQLTGFPQHLPVSLDILRLSSAKVIPLPDISSLPNLTSLMLIMAGMEQGNTALGGFSRLEHLELSLEDVPELSFPVPFSQLQTFTIEYANMMKRFPGDFGLALQRLRKLQISFAAELVELPASISDLRHLSSLEIAMAPKLTSLPDSLGALSRLCRLALKHCPSLELLPDSLTQLACLQSLLLGFTSIRSLPPNFSQLKRLRRLQLCACKQLQALPEDLTELRMLRYLTIVGSKQLLDREKHPHGIYRMYGLEIFS